MNCKKWISTLTLCAVTLAATTAGIIPAQAADTGVVSSAPDLGAAADAMAAAGDTNTQPVPPANGAASDSDTATVGYDQVTLATPAATVGGQTYLPLRDTFAAMKNQALSVEWKADGQSKVKLSGSVTSYEVYLTNGDTAIQIQQGGTTYPLQNIAGVTYAPLAFFQAIIQLSTIALSGDSTLTLKAKNGSDVWGSTQAFWTGMNTYQAPAAPQEPQPPVVPEEPTQPTPPEVDYPDVDDPSDSTGDITDGDNGGSLVPPDVDTSTLAGQIINCALQYIGVPYVWGGTTPDGFDCSGLVQYVYAQYGISLPRVTYDQQAVATPVSLVALQPGDLVFWGESAYHVGIYIGDGKYIHAPAPGQNVTIGSYDTYAYTSGGRVIG